MRLKAKDLMRILSAVDGDSDVIFHIDDDDNNRYSADSVTFKEGQRYDYANDETEITLHINLYYSGVYNPKLDEVPECDELEKQIRAALRKCNDDRKAAAKLLGVSDRTLYRKLKQYDII